jgi:hypothetical protein
MNFTGYVATRSISLSWIVVAYCCATVTARSPEPSAKLGAALDRVIKRHGFMDSTIFHRAD